MAQNPQIYELKARYTLKAKGNRTNNDTHTVKMDHGSRRHTWTFYILIVDKNIKKELEALHKMFFEQIAF